MNVRTGFERDEFGRPVKSLSVDLGPGQAFSASGWHGSMVVGQSGSRERAPDPKATERTRAFRERHGGRVAR